MPSLRAWLVAVPVGALLFLCGNGLRRGRGADAPVERRRRGLRDDAARRLGSRMAFRGERPTRAEILGMVLGIAGVALLGDRLAARGRGLARAAHPARAGRLGDRLAHRALRGGEGRAVRGLGAAGAQMIAGGVWMLLMSLVLGEHLPASSRGAASLAWGYLVVFGSLVGFTAYSWLLANARPAVAMSYAYVNPVIAVLLGAALGGETLGWATLRRDRADRRRRDGRGGDRARPKR